MMQCIGRLVSVASLQQPAAAAAAGAIVGFRGIHKTVLHDFHVANGGKMVEFAGYSMPVQYGKVGVAASHKHVRSCCGLFDVSHMLQSRVHGEHRVEFVESITVADVAGLKPDTGCLSLFTNDRGGIIDDLIITNTSQDHVYIVSNAGCREKDLTHMRAKLAQFVASGRKAELQVLDDCALVALQGPKAAAVLQAACSADLASVAFMGSVVCDVAGVADCRVTRCGYTGEDGFEISMPQDKAVEVCEALVSSTVAEVQLAGLGARDSLRLEAGLCLYGNDITEDTTPVQAALAWVVARSRRKPGAFPGVEVILAELKSKAAVRRVGLVSKGAPVRPPAEVIGPDGTTVGKVCSGCPAPSLGINVSMAYVPTALSKVGTELQVNVRNKLILATVTKMPFIQSNYYAIPK